MPYRNIAPIIERTWSEQIWWPSPRDPQWIMTQTCEEDSPKTAAVRSSKISSTT